MPLPGKAEMFDQETDQLLHVFTHVAKRVFIALQGILGERGCRELMRGTREASSGPISGFY